MSGPDKNWLIPWHRQTREEKILEVAWLVWLGLVFLGAPLLWLGLWVAGG